MHAVGIANPASVACQEAGGREEGSDCFFPDGSVCDLWAFARGECSQGEQSVQVEGSLRGKTRLQRLGLLLGIGGLAFLLVRIPMRARGYA